MGAHPWIYFVPHQPDIKKAMLELREREFQAGRCNPVIAFPHMTGGAPGAQHDSIEEAREAADADGSSRNRGKGAGSAQRGLRSSAAP